MADISNVGDVQGPKPPEELGIISRAIGKISEVGRAISLRMPSVPNLISITEAAVEKKESIKKWANEVYSNASSYCKALTNVISISGNYPSNLSLSRNIFSPVMKLMSDFNTKKEISSPVYITYESISIEQKESTGGLQEYESERKAADDTIRSKYSISPSVKLDKIACCIEDKSEPLSLLSDWNYLSKYNYAFSTNEQTWRQYGITTADELRNVCRWTYDVCHKKDDKELDKIRESTLFLAAAPPLPY